MFINGTEQLIAQQLSRMQSSMSMLTLSLVVLVAAAGTALGDDDCAPPAPGQKRTSPKACCQLGGVWPSSLKTAADKCKQKYPMMRPSGPPPTGVPPTPSTEMRTARACTGECTYSEVGLLTAAQQLTDKASLLKYYTPTDANLVPVVAAAVDKCYASYAADIDTSLQCKSGAEEFHKCLIRETFLNCPSALWTASTDCQELKAKLVKCPKMPLKMGRGGPRGPTQ